MCYKSNKPKKIWEGGNMEYKIVTVEEERLNDAKERLMSEVNFLLKQGYLQ